MNRTQLQRLAEERLGDAEALLNVGRWSGAYYLAGYAVECGLKACIARLTNQDDYSNKKFANDCYTHDIAALVVHARLDNQRRSDELINPTFGINWLIAKDWNEQARYEEWIEPEARKLYIAVADSTNGVLPWTKSRW